MENAGVAELADAHSTGSIPVAGIIEILLKRDPVNRVLF